jgi:hypothetical protein
LEGAASVNRDRADPLSTTDFAQRSGRGHRQLADAHSRRLCVDWQDIVHYSHIDFYLLQINEVYDKRNLLPEKWKGKQEKMAIGDAETAVAAGPDWTDNHLLALQRIREFRKTRNLMAHFAVKRFPNEDAFLFLANNERDFKKVLGTVWRRKMEWP